ncbi:MAG: tetratricopeptide repeat protein [Actinomycetes bacterium]
MNDQALPRPDGDAELPAGDVYDWYQRGCRLLDEGNAAAAVQLLARVSESEPSARHARETLGRARLAAGQYAAAETDFAHLVASAPDDDYAHLGLGMALARQGRFEEAVEHLALAVAMRPDRPEYASQLQHVRATLRARADPL